MTEPPEQARTCTAQSSLRGSSGAISTPAAALPPSSLCITLMSQVSHNAEPRSPLVMWTAEAIYIGCIADAQGCAYTGLSNSLLAHTRKQLLLHRVSI